jgi:hypothetical protein
MKTNKKKKIIQRERARLKRDKPIVVKNLLKDHICKNCHWSHSGSYFLACCTNPVRVQRKKNYPPYLKSVDFPKDLSCRHWQKWDRYA